jgi:hypothetical protein
MRKLVLLFLVVCVLGAQQAVRYTGMPGTVPLAIGNGTGNVVGPGSSTNNDCVKFGDTTGKLIADAGAPCGSGAIFTGVTAVTSAFSATPTFSLAAVSSKSPVRFEPGAMTANVTSVTITNKVAGAKFSIAWLQDGTGGRTVAYGGSASNTCAPSTTASKTTVQQFEVAADGSTVVGTGCSSDDALDTPVTGPASSTNGNIPTFNGSTGKVIGTGITPGTGVATALAANVSGSGSICLSSGSACAGGTLGNCSQSGLAPVSVTTSDTVVAQCSPAVALGAGHCWNYEITFTYTTAFMSAMKAWIGTSAGAGSSVSRAAGPSNTNPINLKGTICNHNGVQNAQDLTMFTTMQQTSGDFSDQGTGNQDGTATNLIISITLSTTAGTATVTVQSFEAKGV